MAKNDKLWLGIDLGGTKILITLFDDDLSPLAKNKVKTLGHEGAEKGVDRIVETAKDTLKEAGVKKSQLQGVGMAIAGMLDLKKGVLVEAPNLGWKDIPIQKTLEKELDCPVYLANDVDAGTYGEYALGEAKDARCVLGVFAGTGVGAGMVYEKRIFTGRKTSCLELGHTVVNASGLLFEGPESGTVEALAGRRLISQQAVGEVMRGYAPVLEEQAGTDLFNVRSKALKKSVEGGDEKVEQVIRRAAAWLGIGIGNAVNLLAPDYIVLGGGLVEAFPDLYLKEVKQSMKQVVMEVYKDEYTLATAKLGDHAGVVGAAAWARFCVEES